MVCRVKERRRTWRQKGTMRRCSWTKNCRRTQRRTSTPSSPPAANLPQNQTSTGTPSIHFHSLSFKLKLFYYRGLFVFISHSNIIYFWCSIIMSFYLTHIQLSVQLELSDVIVLRSYCGRWPCGRSWRSIAFHISRTTRI